MGKLTISAMFNSYVSHYQRVDAPRISRIKHCICLDPLVPSETPGKAVKVLATPLQWHSLPWSTGLKWPVVFLSKQKLETGLDKSSSRVYPFLKYWTNEIFWGILILTLPAPWRCNLTFSVSHTPKWFASRDVLSVDGTTCFHTLKISYLRLPWFIRWYP